MPSISFGTRRIARTQEAFMNGGFGFIEEFTADEEAFIKDKLEQSLLLIKKLDSRLFEMVRILISDIVFVKSPLKENNGGGLVEKPDYFSGYGQAIIQQMSSFITVSNFDYLKKVINDRQFAQFHE